MAESAGAATGGIARSHSGYNPRLQAGSNVYPTFTCRLTSLAARPRRRLRSQGERLAGHAAARGGGDGGEASVVDRLIGQRPEVAVDGGAARRVPQALGEQDARHSLGGV